MAAYIPPLIFDRRSMDSSSTLPTTPLQSSFGISPGKPKRMSLKVKRSPKLLTKLRQPRKSGSDVLPAELEEACQDDPRVQLAKPHEAGRPEGTEQLDEQHVRFLEWLNGHEQVDHGGKGGLGKGEARYFRCDIFATNGEDHTEAEMECKQLVIEAGGGILDDYEYVGGFLYTLPSTISTPPPLESSDETLQGGYVRITPWTIWKPPCPSPLRMNPPSDSLAHIELPAPAKQSPVSPLPTDPSPPRLTPQSPTPISPASTSPASLKQWPRPRDLDTTKRAGDWVSKQAVKRKQKLHQEAKDGTGLEVVDRARGYEGGVQIQGLYMNGYSDLAVWMDGEGSRSSSRNDL